MRGTFLSGCKSSAQRMAAAIKAIAKRVGKGVDLAVAKIHDAKESIHAKKEELIGKVLDTRKRFLESKAFVNCIILWFSVMTVCYLCIPVGLTGYYYNGLIAFLNFKDTIFAELTVCGFVEFCVLIFSGKILYRQSKWIETGNLIGNNSVREVARVWMIGCYAICFVINKFCKKPIVQIYLIRGTDKANPIRLIGVAANFLTDSCRKELGENAEAEVEKVLPFLKEENKK